MTAWTTMSRLKMEQEFAFIETDEFIASLDAALSGNPPIDSTEPAAYRYQMERHTGELASVTFTAKAQQSHLHSYTGAVYAIPTSSQPNAESEIVIVSALCTSDRPSRDAPTLAAVPPVTQTPDLCPSGFTLY